MPEPPIRQPLAVSAPFDSTWSAVIDHFAFSNMPIATIDKSSGFISTSKMSVEPQKGIDWASCGVNRELRIEYGPHAVTYNVVVRGSGPSSTVVVSAFWERADRTCVTRGTWESTLESAIKKRAEL